ncbi:MAG TPA: hypothetical protein PLG43_08565 [Spirochaetia bacterium]|jgi:hypothetical protein|nr:hypothetical protein [Spirochaetia bacterium]
MKSRTYVLFNVFMLLGSIVFGLSENTRHEVHPYQSIESILKNPTTISFSVSEDQGGRDRLTASCDMHAIYPIEARRLYAILQDTAKTEAAFSDIVRVQNAARNGYDPNHFLQRQVIEISALGITKTYDYILDMRMEVSNDGKEFKSAWTLADSPDGTFSEVTGSWYFKEFENAGKIYTYVRNFTSNTMINTIAGQKLILKLFAEGRIKKTMDELFSAALQVR